MQIITQNAVEDPSPHLDAKRPTAPPRYVSLQIRCRRSDCPFLPAVALPAPKLPPQGRVNTHDKDASSARCQPEGAYSPQVIETWSH